MYLEKQKSTGMKLPSAFWKMQWRSKCLFEWMSTETVTNKPRSSDRKLYVTDTEGIPATYEMPGNRASWWGTEHNVYFTESSWTILAHWGSSLACDKRSLSVVGLPRLFQKPPDRLYLPAGSSGMSSTYCFPHSSQEQELRLLFQPLSWQMIKEKCPDFAKSQGSCYFVIDKILLLKRNCSLSYACILMEITLI